MPFPCLMMPLHMPTESGTESISRPSYEFFGLPHLGFLAINKLIRDITRSSKDISACQYENHYSLRSLPYGVKMPVLLYQE